MVLPRLFTAAAAARDLEVLPLPGAVLAPRARLARAPGQVEERAHLEKHRERVGKTLFDTI